MQHTLSRTDNLLLTTNTFNVKDGYHTCTMYSSSTFHIFSVLKTFIYDPLVEWSKPAKGRSNPTESGEIKNEQVSISCNYLKELQLILVVC